MNRDDLEKVLKNARPEHLAREELQSYRDGRLDRIGLAIAEAHLKRCRLCEENLKAVRVLGEEPGAFEKPDITPEDVAIVKPAIRQAELEAGPSGVQRRKPAPVGLQERLAAYLQQVVESWQAYFGQLKPVHRGTEGGKEIWRWDSEDQGLTVWAVFEKNTDLSIHFSSSDLDMEGTRLKVALGRFSGEVTLERRVSQSDVYSKFVVPRQKRPKKLEDISIETVGLPRSDGR